MVGWFLCCQANGSDISTISLNRRKIDEMANEDNDNLETFMESDKIIDWNSDKLETVIGFRIQPQNRFNNI
jgi:hypothetical protein